MTDLFDATDIASVRMYVGARQVMAGLLKNATEGMAGPRLIWLFSVLLIGGSVLPVLSLPVAIYGQWPTPTWWLLGLATGLSYLPRLMITARFRQSWLGACLHPLGVAWFMGLQWLALLRQWLGRPPVPWRGRP